MYNVNISTNLIGYYKKSMYLEKDYMDNKNIINPCIAVCRSDPITDYCYGCGRITEEKKIWKDPDTSNKWKKNNLNLIRSRLNGWQLDAFDKSYTYKKENGISLLKKKLTELKK